MSCQQSSISYVASRLVALAALGLVVVTGGCFGARDAAAVAAPAVDPQAAAKKAISSYDKNGDGKLAGAELSAVPAIERFLAEYDRDSDKAVSEAEIAQRLQAVFSSGAMLPFTCTIIHGGQPLEGAEVTFEPEVFLADQLKVAHGTTRGDGTAQVVVPDEQLPEENRGLRALYTGVYKISVSHPSVQLPAAYKGSQTVLGYEVNGLTNWGDKATFVLDSKGTKPK